jgi:hypothetical protein
VSAGNRSGESPGLPESCWHNRAGDVVHSVGRSSTEGLGPSRQAGGPEKADLGMTRLAASVATPESEGKGDVAW